MEKNNPTPDTKTRRVLLLDDDHQILDLYKLLLPQMLPNCAFTITDNGIQALDGFNLCPYDVVVSDIDMDFINGDDVFKQIQQICQARNIPLPRFIFCSGVGTALNEMQTLFPDHPVDLVLKPFDLTHLAELINR